MTIYKTQSGEKKTDKEPEVLKEPLTGTKDEADSEEPLGMAPKLVRVTYFPRRRRTWVNLCLVMTALVVLGTGTIAAIFLYKHLSAKVVRGRCGVTYYDEVFHQQDPMKMQGGSLMNSPQQLTQMDLMQEDIEVSESDRYEHLKIPKFDEVEETVVWHDFDRNLTAIVDPTHRNCYIMPLNRSRISPPRDLIDLINKLKTGYYMPKASVVREQFRIVLPPMGDLSVLGEFIMRECYWYDTYRLEPFVSGVVKRSADALVPEKPILLGYFSYNKDEHSAIYKMSVYGLMEAKKENQQQTTASIIQ